MFSLYSLQLNIPDDIWGHGPGMILHIADKKAVDIVHWSLKEQQTLHIMLSWRDAECLHSLLRKLIVRDQKRQKEDHLFTKNKQLQTNCWV